MSRVGFCCVDFDMGVGVGVGVHVGVVALRIPVLSFITVLKSLEIIKMD